MTRGIARQWLVRMNVAPIRGIDNGKREAKRLSCAWLPMYHVGRVTSRTKGQVGCSAIKPRREPRGSSKPRCPSICRLPHCTWASNSFVHCLSVCPAWPCQMPVVACCHKPHSIRLRRFPKISLPHSQRSPPQRPLQALAHTLALEIQVPVTAAKITTF
jgi:hypothetical protein